jgi:Phosphodiester glycosidase
MTLSDAFKMTLTVSVTLLLARAAYCRPPASQPFPGITYGEEVRHDAPLRLYWVQADLSNPAVHLRLCRGGPPPEASGYWETTLLQVSKIARREHLDVAVNGSFFSPHEYELILGKKLPYFEGNWAKASGWTVSDGQVWSEHPISLAFPSLVVSTDGAVAIGRYTRVPPHTEQMVSGYAMLVRDGRNIAPNQPAAPRTAVGIDATGKTLTLLVVDGRRMDDSVGLTMKQMGDEMIRLGCTSALNLDSGGSTTLVIRHGEDWPVINRPSDGHDLLIPLSVERPVANAFGISVDPGN